MNGRRSCDGEPPLAPLGHRITDGRHHVIDDDYGVSEWRLTGTLLDGSRIDVLGCDFLTVREGKIARKSSFRKQRPLLPE